MSGLSSTESVGTIFLKVINIQILTSSTPFQQGSNVYSAMHLKFELEDSSEFMMSAIPVEIALEISRCLNEDEVRDSRLRVWDVIKEISIVEKVEIDSMVPQTQVYQATIELSVEGFSNSLRYQMVPSHATLLAVVSSAPIYISQDLVIQAQSSPLD